MSLSDIVYKYVCREHNNSFHPNAWITDNIINAAQKLLKKANPILPGLQDVACGLTINFDVHPGEFVQILHVGEGHWNTVSTIGTCHPEVQIYDSMFNYLPSMGKARIAALLATNERLNSMDVQNNVGRMTVAFSPFHLPQL